MGYKLLIGVLFLAVLLFASILPLRIWGRTGSWRKTVLWSYVIVSLGSALLGGVLMTAAAAADIYLLSGGQPEHPEESNALRLTRTFLLLGWVFAGIAVSWLPVGFLIIPVWRAVKSERARGRSPERCPLCGCLPPERGEFCEKCRER